VEYVIIITFNLFVAKAKKSYSRTKSHPYYLRTAVHAKSCFGIIRYLRILNRLDANMRKLSCWVLLKNVPIGNLVGHDTGLPSSSQLTQLQISLSRSMMT
jgi:hypothetical protein